MFGWFAAENEICKVFSVWGAPRVLIHQAPSDSPLDRSNTTSGFLVLEMADTDADLAAALFAPQIALLPTLGQTNDRLLSFLRSQRVSVDLIDAIEAGQSHWAKMDAAICRQHRASVRNKALESNGSFTQAFLATTRSFDEEIKLVQVRAHQDNLRLQETIEFLKQAGLAREETIPALGYVVDQLIAHREGKKIGLTKRKEIAEKVEHLILNHPQLKPEP